MSIKRCDALSIYCYLHYRPVPSKDHFSESVAIIEYYCNNVIIMQCPVPLFMLDYSMFTLSGGV